MQSFTTGASAPAYTVDPLAAHQVIRARGNASRTAPTTGSLISPSPITSPIE
jgi:hypothetical protein